MDFEKDPAFQGFIQLLRENGRPEQAQDLSVLAWYIDGMERQLDAALRELHDTKEQLAEMSDHTPSQKPFARAVEALETRVEQAKETISHFRNTIVSCARDAVDRFKDMGVSALDTAVAVMGVRKGLEQIQKSLQESVTGARAVIERGEQVGRELRSAGSHLKGAVRAAAGKEVQQPDVTQEGRFQAVVLAPARGVHAALSKVNNRAIAAIGAVEHLEAKGKQARENQAERAARKPGKRLIKKPSIRQALKEKQAAITAKTASAPEHEKAQGAAL